MFCLTTAYRGVVVTTTKVPVVTPGAAGETNLRAARGSLGANPAFSRAGVRRRRRLCAGYGAVACVFGVCLWRNCAPASGGRCSAEPSGLVRGRFRSAIGKTCARIWHRNLPVGLPSGRWRAEFGVADATQDWTESGDGGRDADASWAGADQYDPVLGRPSAAGLAAIPAFSTVLPVARGG